MSRFCVNGVSDVCAAGYSEGTELIYLKGREVSGNPVYSKFYPVWCDYHDDISTQSFHYLLCFERTYIWLSFNI